MDGDDILNASSRRRAPVEDPWRSLVSGIQGDQGYVQSDGDRHEIAVDRLSSEDTGVVCLRSECEMGDIECLLNRTKSIQYQHVSLPTVLRLEEPFVLVAVHMVGHSVYPNLAFTIENGNEHGHFDVVQDYVGDDHGSLRLLKPIRGPNTYVVRLRMDNRSSYGSVITTHYAVIKVYVSRYSL